MDAEFGPEWRFESFSDVDHRETSRDGVGIVAMYELMKRVEISLAISPGLAVFSHDGLGLNRNTDCCGRRLLNALSGYDTCEGCGGRPEHEVDVPLAPGDDDLALDVVDQIPGGGMFRDLGTHSQQIDEYELAQDLSMNVGTRMVTGLAKVPDYLIGGGH